MSKFVPFHAESVAYAKKITEGIKETLDKYKEITSFISREIGYDYVRAVKIEKKNGLPDIDHVWKTHLGICMDTAALTTGMLRAAGINASMCVGKADKMPHAWVEANINGTKYRYDHDSKAKTYKTEKRY